jgi:uncharacterized protein
MLKERNQVTCRVDKRSASTMRAPQRVDALRLSTLLMLRRQACPAARHIRISLSSTAATPGTPHQIRGHTPLKPIRQTMQKFFRRYLPDPHTLREHRLLRFLGSSVLADPLWHINRRSVATGVAIGMFCGLIPGPLQMLGAALACVVLRGNLPLALVATFYTNPLTIVPLYVLAFGIGRFITGSDAAFIMPPERGDSGMTDWISSLFDWFTHLGQPLLVGLPVLAASLAVLAWVLITLVWRWSIWRRTQARRQMRRTQ